MNWTDGISNALKYIEEHLKEDIKIVDVANEAYVSSFYFQKAFRIHVVLVLQSIFVIEDYH